MGDEHEIGIESLAKNGAKIGKEFGDMGRKNGLNVGIRDREKRRRGRRESGKRRRMFKTMMEVSAQSSQKCGMDFFGGELVEIERCVGRGQEGIGRRG